MTKTDHTKSNISFASSEIWGDVDDRLNSGYSNFKEIHRSGFFRIIMATRYGRKVILKSLVEKYKDSSKYQEFLHKGMF